MAKNLCMNLVDIFNMAAKPTNEVFEAISVESHTRVYRAATAASSVAAPTRARFPLDHHKLHS